MLISARRFWMSWAAAFLDNCHLDETQPHGFIGPAHIDQLILVVPAKREVCFRCNGEGVHDHPAFSNGITGAEFDEDPDFREEYMDGRYNVTCSECKGLRVVDTADWDRMTRRQQDLANAHWEEQAYADAEHAAELRMGC